MHLNPSVFRSYDIRGIASKDLTPEFANALARAFVHWLRTQGEKPSTVVVGRDMRKSSASLEHALIAGFIRVGMQVKSIGLVASEQFYYACATADAPGIIVTASHNPPEYGGFKIVKRVPEFVGGVALQQIRGLMENHDYAPDTVGGAQEPWDIHQGYTQTVRGFVNRKRWERKLKVIADTANGMGGPMVEEVLRGLPVDLEILFAKPDGTFPNHPADPLIAENREFVEHAVRKENADLGFAFDGDADRIFVIDENGQTLPGDFVAALLGEYFARREPGATVIYDVRSSWAVRDLVSTVGGKSLMHLVGHTNIKRKMAEMAAVFGGELSGHFYYRDFFRCDSSMITALLFIDLLSAGPLRLSEIVAPLRSAYFLSGELNFTVSSIPEVLDKLRQHFAGSSNMYELDGLSVEEKDWHFNLRPSNTEPLLRLNVEALSREMLEEKVGELTRLIVEESRK